MRCCQCKRPAEEGLKRCRPCLDANNRRTRQWRHTERGRTQGRLYLAAHRKSRRPEGACFLCHATQDLHLDHDHATGIVRGVLCGKHNRALGLFGDSPQMLRAAADYLERASDGVRYPRVD